VTTVYVPGIATAAALAAPQIDLRVYQTAGVAAMRAAFATRKRRVLVVSPTGSGKGTLAAYLIVASWLLGRRVLFLVHRRELIRDMVKRVKAGGCTSLGVIVAGDVLRDTDGTVLARANAAAPVQIASVDSIRNRALPAADLVIVDEAHRAMNPSTRAVIEAYPAARVLGLTATPIRLDRKTLDELFEELIVLALPSELIAAGWIVRARVFTVPRDQLPDTSGVRLTAGDFNQRQLAQAVARRPLVGSIVEHWKRRAPDTKTIGFAVSIDHSKMIIDEFKAAGIGVDHVDGSMKTADRDRIIGKWRAGEFPILTQCNLLVEGFDDPEIETVILARPTQSLTILLQSCGRACRPFGEKQTVILDHAGNIAVHGLPEQDRDWHELWRGRPRRRRGGAVESPVRTCPMCFAVLPAGTPECPCGYQFPPGTRGPPTTVDGELVEVEPPDPLATRREFWARTWRQAHRDGQDMAWVVTKFRGKYPGEDVPREFAEPERPPSSPQERAVAWAELQRVARTNGFPERWAAKKYHNRFGEDPPAPGAPEATTTPVDDLFDEAL